MSNAMSRSKSRWKGALLATVAAAVISPVVAKAQSMTVGIYANPLGGAAGSNVYGGTSNVYIDPYDTDTLYVYATINGTAAPSTSYVDGLNYLYFNVNAATTGVAGLGAISAATPSSMFGGGSFNQTSGNTAPSAGAQGGLISTTAYSSTPSIAVGSNSSAGSLAKPRSAGDVYWNSSTGSGANVVVSGNNVSFLVETLTYTPNATAVKASPSAQGSANSVSFNVSIPSATLVGGTTIYPSTNYFVGLPSTPAVGASPSLANTSTGASYTASASNITLTQALPGDDNLDGTVNGADFTKLVNNLNNQNNGGATYTSPQFTLGDFNGDGIINGADFTTLVNNFNFSLGNAPSALAQLTAWATANGEIAALDAGLAANPTFSSVPEPTSLSLIALGGVMLLGRKRNNSTV